MSRSSKHDVLIKQTSRLTLQARALLFWERYAPVFALASAFIALYMIAAFAGVWERIGDPWRLIALLVSLYFLVKAILAARTKKIPTKSEARRRVETDSGVAHRPLDVLEDRPVFSENLWDRHYRNARDKAATLERPKGIAVLAPMDNLYLRFILPFAVMLALMVGAGDNFERLRRSLVPTWQAGISPSDVKFEAWVDPPDYTGRPPIYFKNKTKIDVPAGSELVARLSGARDATRLKISTPKRARYLPLEQLGPRSFETRTIIDEKSVARWRVGTLEKKWTINALPDEKPTVTFDVNPRADKRDRLAFTYSFEDDYGVEELLLIMTPLSDDPTIAAQSDTVSVPLSSSSQRKAEFKEAALDLTKHRWAGQKVSARLVAVDGLKQSNQTQEVYFIIPDKIFVEPLAKAIIEHRNLVLAGQEAYGPEPEITSFKEWQRQPWFDTWETDKRLGRGHENLARAADLIDAVTDLPQGLFEDPAVYMGLKNVHGRLRYARDLDGLAGIPEDLWSIAVRAEYGVLGTALEEMREAQRALNDGIARRAPQREIDALFERYNEAVDRYMEELRRNATVTEADGGGGGGGRNADEIQELLDAIEEANRIGDTEGARKALAQLAELLERLQIQLTTGGEGGEGDPMEGEMSEEQRKQLEELADLLGEQRELQDETEQAENQEGQEGEEGQDGDQSGQEAGNQDGGEQAGGEQSGGEQAGGEQAGGEQAGGEQSGRAGNQGRTVLTPSELADQQAALERALDALAQGLAENGEEAGGSGDEEGEDATGGDGEEGEDGAGGGDGDETQDARGGGGIEDAEEALGNARRAMGEARQLLQDGDLEGAGNAQGRAIDALRETGNSLAEQIENARREGEGETAENSDNTDPLGRQNGGQNNDNSQADIDTKDNATRSREILKELRRRASEQEREQSERDYLERLLKRF